MQKLLSNLLGKSLGINLWKKETKHMIKTVQLI